MVKTRRFTYSWSNCLPKRWQTPRRIFFWRDCQVRRWSSPSRALPHTCSWRCGIVPEGFRYRASRRVPSFLWNARAARVVWPSGTAGPLVRRQGVPPGPTRTPDLEAGNISTCLRGTRACPLTGNRILEGDASRILRVREVRSHSPPRQGRFLCQDVSGTNNYPSIIFHYNWIISMIFIFWKITKCSKIYKIFERKYIYLKGETDAYFFRNFCSYIYTNFNIYKYTKWLFSI